MYKMSTPTRNTNQNRTPSQTQPDTLKHITPQPSTPIKHAGSDIWEMSLRYKYPTINTDTYRMNGNRTEDR